MHEPDLLQYVPALMQMAINRYRGAQFLLRALDDVPVQRAREEERLAQEADINAYYQVHLVGLILEGGGF